MKNLKYIFAALVLALSVSSCLVDDEESTEFAESDFVVGFQTTSVNESFFVDEGVVVRNYPLNVLGGGPGTPLKQDVVVSYTISPDSDAVNGQEYDLAASGTVTILAGSTFANFPLNINTGGFDPDAPTTLIIDLTTTSTDNSVVSSLNNQLTVTFVGCQSNVADFTYFVTTTRDSDGSVRSSGLENISVNGVNDFRTESTARFGANGLQPLPAGRPGFDFLDVCGDITIPKQSLNGVYTNQVFGTGKVDPATGNIEFNYTVTFGDTNGLFTTKHVRQ